LTTDAKIDATRWPVLKDLDWPARIQNRTSALFTIMVIGQVSSGKSSFINSLLGRKLLLPADRPTDGVVSVLMAVEEGRDEYAEKLLLDGTVEQFSTMEMAMKFLRQQETSIEDQQLCREVRLYLNESWLKRLRVVNTPGLGDRLEAFEAATRRYMQEDESDLIVWTFFPETAANREEVKLFGEILAERRASVVGVVTRCLEGKEDDLQYEPSNDPGLVGNGGVVASLREHLGKYISDIVLYDSHQARRLVAQMRENPGVCTSVNFEKQLERCGQLNWKRTLDKISLLSHKIVKEFK